MSSANRRRRQLRRNPTRFLVDNIFAETPLQKLLRKKTARRLGCQPHQILDPKYTIGIDLALPGSEVTVEGKEFVDRDGVLYV